MFGQRNKRIYLDHASATPLRNEVKAAMEPYWEGVFGNAGAIHKEGVQARAAVETARVRLAQLLHVRSEGIVFTGSGTESNNLCILGTLFARHAEGVPYEAMEVVSSSIEHPSVLETLKYAETLGVRVVFAPVFDDGLIDIVALQQLLTKKTALVSIAYANSEVGVVQPLGKIARIVRAAEQTFNSRIYFHADGAQAPLWLSCELDRLGVDMLSLDAGKCYGPKGVGVLAFRHGVHLRPHLFGGSQEGGLRPGTENTALIIGAVEALVIAQKHYAARSERIKTLREHFFAALEKIDGVVLNGSREQRIANNVNISVEGLDSEYAVIVLDEKGIACSTKSACGGAFGNGSHVVRAISGSEERAASTLRFTLGEATNAQELNEVVKILAAHVEKMRAFKEGR